MAKTGSSKEELLPQFTVSGDAGALNAYLDDALSVCNAERNWPSESEWQDVSYQMVASLQELLDLPAVQQDPVALSLINGLLASKSFDGFLQGYDAIAEHFTKRLKDNENNSGAVRSQFAKPQKNAGRTRLIL
ncbi:hypothetical protein SAMN04488518_11883 [Pseudovibrio ascidiaceicola]|uniref:Uncharacterized protein n=1 Tax=Pseudovibrio ascidiaceicola TaxID=285279 RepID=A0A1I4FDV0_9HYPH|nr:hypothetical protein [Pseudovibrio ascidiaceicola]SFL15653.1 hypothetical protein SAMN04488518_11883 [Pseudovibrio ascidiaceicola]